MSLIAYRPLATVSAIGPGGKPLTSVTFTPTVSTEALLAGYRLFFRPNPGGFRIAAQHGLGAGGGPLVPLGSEPLSLLFAITSSEPDFLARHATAASSAAGPNLFLTNRSATGTPQTAPGLSRDAKVGAKDMGRIVPRRHRTRVPLKPGPAAKTIELRPYFGGDRIGEPIALDAPTGAEAAEANVDTGAAAGIAFLLRPKPSGDDQLIIADDELARMVALGALELALKSFSGATPAAGRAFTATFET